MATQIWQFPDQETKNDAMEVIAYRHPSNFTKWLDDFTVELSGDVHYQTEQLLRSKGAKKIS